MSSILSFKNLAIGYNERIVAQELNGNLSKGEVLLITGGNGSGKTTLIKTILNEIDQLDGELVANINRYYHLKQNYQESIHLPLTVSEILDGKTSDIKFNSNLRWNDLSGGQKQQVLILRAFSQAVDVIVLDEPLNHLDSESVEVVTKLINKKLKEYDQLSMIIVSHIPIDLDSKVNEVTL